MFIKNEVTNAMENINKTATNYINNLTRINELNDANLYPDKDVLFLPDNINIAVFNDSNIQTNGLNDTLDKKRKDLLRTIIIKDALNIDYEETNILSPSVYIHSLDDKPWHITTQGFLITYINDNLKNFIITANLEYKKHYGKHDLDSFWLNFSKPIDLITSSDIICIFNRRVSGWDGSIDRPVIELLGAGGHLQSVWDENSNKFVSLSLQQNLRKEFDEEIGLDIEDKDIDQIGGFINKSTHELVIFSCININPDKIPDIQTYALNNIEEDTDGIYLGTFNETMDYYRKDPSYFAGGIKAAPTNFPNNDDIMKKIISKYITK